LTNFSGTKLHKKLYKTIKYHISLWEIFMKLKKIIVPAILVLCAVLLFGCLKTDFVSKYGTNITEYSINLTLNEDNTISATQEVSYKNTSGSILNEVLFHLYPNAFSETAVNKPVAKLYESTAYPNGQSYGKIDIEDVNIKKDDCSYAIEGTDKDILKVTLNSPLYPNDFININMTYKLTLPNVLHRFGYSDSTINLANFYPIACVFEGDEWDTSPYSSNGDPFYSNLANYSVSITYPSNLTLAHTGNETNYQQETSTKTSKMEAKAVRDFAMVLSSKFQKLEAKIGETEIEYYYYNDTEPQKSLSTAIASLTTFNETFGDYPYTTLAVVETGFVYGGMEYPNLVMISDNLQSYDDYTNTIVHEIAHQWWYGVVGNDEYENGWLDESLAEYSVVIFYEKNPEYEIERDVCIKNAITSYTLFVDVYKDVFNEVDTSMNRNLDEFDTEPEYVYAVYVKGMIMFDDIRNFIGDRNFFNSLKNYYKKYGGKNATPENLIDVFEDTSNKRLKSIFTSYIDGTAIIGNVSNKEN
jgi:hypothetical protein